MYLIGERFNQIKIMKNASSLFLTLVSYLVVMGAILFLLFMAIPLSLKAQTNADMVTTNTAVTNATAPATAAVPPVPPTYTNHRDDHDDLGFGKTMVAVVPVLSSFIMPIAIVAVVFYFKHRRNRLEHETVQMMIEKGLPVTPEIIAALKGKGDQDKNSGRTGHTRSPLLAGLILAGIGIGVIAVAGKPGLIVLFIGVAFLVVWFVEGRKQNDKQPPQA